MSINLLLNGGSLIEPYESRVSESNFDSKFSRIIMENVLVKAVIAVAYYALSSLPTDQDDCLPAIYFICQQI